MVFVYSPPTLLIVSSKMWLSCYVHSFLSFFLCWNAKLKAFRNFFLLKQQRRGCSARNKYISNVPYIVMIHTLYTDIILDNTSIDIGIVDSDRYMSCSKAGGVE